MKYILLTSFFSILGYSQSAIGSINSGAVSNDNLMHSVGEIYVIPTDPGETNSGTMGLLYQSVIKVLGVDEIQQESVKIYPNPTSDFIYLNVSSKTKIEDIQVFDNSGRVVLKTTIKDNKIDLRNLPVGVYILTFGNEDIKPTKIIKKP